MDSCPLFAFQFSRFAPFSIFSFPFSMCTFHSLLIETPKRLKTAVIQTKQTTEGSSNRVNFEGVYGINLEAQTQRRRRSEQRPYDRAATHGTSKVAGKMPAPRGERQIQKRRQDIGSTIGNESGNPR
jgi:hypothetical protein